MTRAERHLLIGVDGGGSGCRAGARWHGEDRIHAAEAGPANATTDPDAALANIVSAIGAAARTAGATTEELAHATAHLGVAGVLDPEIAARFARAVPVAACRVTEDREIQVFGMLGGRPGFVLAIGTGTIVATLGKDGVRGLGGWGFALSDRGSGADLGRAALRLALDCEDGMAEHSPMTRTMMAELGGSAAAIAAFGARAGARDYAHFAPRILDFARGGDRHATDILRNAAAYFDRALGVLGLRPGDRLCLGGGVGPHYRDHLASARSARMVAPVGSAVEGALALAALAREAAR